jgi:hypothetical protein
MNVLLQLSQLSVSDASTNEEGIQFALVPHDTSRPIRTVWLPLSVATETPGDAIPTFVKPYFADNKSIDASLLQQQATKHFATGDLKDLAKEKLSVAAVNSVAAQGSVETFPLVHPEDTNQYTGVYIYLDEIGLLKKLAPNSRASAIAACCGYEATTKFYGDIFIGRVRTQPTLKNVDFVPGVDTDGGAEWMRRAVSENLAWQQTANEISRRKGVAPMGTDGNAAKETNFSWTQDDDEVEISVPFDSPVDKNSIKVVFRNKSVLVRYNNEEYVVIDLYGSIDMDGCAWTVDKNILVVTVEKADAGVAWPRISLC